MKGWMKENCVIYVCTAAMVIVLYAMSNSWHSLWALLMLLCVKSPQKKCANCGHRLGNDDGGSNAGA